MTLSSSLYYLSWKDILVCCYWALWIFILTFLVKRVCILFYWGGGCLSCRTHWNVNYILLQSPSSITPYPPLPPNLWPAILNVWYFQKGECGCRTTRRSPFMPLLNSPGQVLFIQPIRNWNSHLPVIQTSGPGWWHVQGQRPGIIRGLRLQTAVPTAAMIVLRPTRPSYR